MSEKNNTYLPKEGVIDRTKIEGYSLSPPPDIADFRKLGLAKPLFGEPILGGLSCSASQVD